MLMPSTTFYENWKNDFAGRIILLEEGPHAPGNVQPWLRDHKEMQFQACSETLPGEMEVDSPGGNILLEE